MSRMNEKAIIVLLFIMLWFAFSTLPPTTIAVPSSRSLKSITHDNSSAPQLVYDDSFQKKERMDIEVDDYPGSGANTRHVPRPPGKKAESPDQRA